MKLDTRALRHLTSEDWRVLTAVREYNPNAILIQPFRNVTPPSHRSEAYMAHATMVSHRWSKVARTMSWYRQR